MNTAKIVSAVMISTVFGLSGCQFKSDPSAPDVYSIQRQNMVRWDIKKQGVESERVLQAMQNVPRHLFLPSKIRPQAYEDRDLPIGPYITTPRPFIVAKTIELLELKGQEKVLEVGTGRGYQSALLGVLAREVYTIEIVPKVAEGARTTLERLGFKNVHVRTGDGYQGWPEHGPFDAILVTASAPAVPQPLIDQLALGGRLLMPVGGAEEQSLVLYRNTPKGLKEEAIMPVSMKPLEGQASRKRY